MLSDFDGCVVEKILLFYFQSVDALPQGPFLMRRSHQKREKRGSRVVLIVVAVVEVVHFFFEFKAMNISLKKEETPR